MSWAHSPPFQGQCEDSDWKWLLESFTIHDSFSERSDIPLALEKPVVDAAFLAYSGCRA